MPNRHPYLPDAGAFAGWSSPLAARADDPDADVPWFTREEERRIANFQIPGEDMGDRDFGDTALYYPRPPKESPSKWQKRHYSRLRGLELAEGMR